ncbi:MAG TPA: DUF2007 domain-containing protein [Flavobacteriales bacterium]|nr:DUF2007 domain-containing protein [Flavobacteriales bacterium]
MTSADDFDLVPVRFYDDPLEAHMDRCLLENEGMAAFVHDEHIVGLNRLFSYAVGGVKLKVRHGDLAEARRILDITDHRPFLDAAGQPISCLQCGSQELMASTTTPRSAKGIFHWLVALLFAVYPISVIRSYQCLHCGHQFPAATEDNKTAGPAA